MEEAECEMVCVKNFQKYFFVFFRRRRRRKVVSFFFLLLLTLRIHPALLFSRGFRRGAPRREERERERERERPKATKSSASVVVYVVVLFERAALKKELFSRSSSELY